MLSDQVNGLYWIFFGDTHIFAATSKDLQQWDVMEEPLISPRAGFVVFGEGPGVRRQ